MIQYIIWWCAPPGSGIVTKHLGIRAVILSAAKDLCGRLARSFAALRMTGRTPLKFAHRKPYLQMSNSLTH